MSEEQMSVEENKLLMIFLPGVGAVATTFIAGVLANTTVGKPIIGSVCQNQRMISDHNVKIISDSLSLPKLSNLRFAGWDITETDAYTSALKADVLNAQDLAPIKDQMAAIKPMKGVFNRHFVPSLEPDFVKELTSKRAMVNALMQDISDSMQKQNCEDAVMVWCGSTERYTAVQDVHQTIEAFEEGLDQDHEAISPSMMYAYAAIKSGVPFANGAPNLTIDVPALQQLAIKEEVPIAGKDFKTGQTFMKTLVAPGIKAKSLGMKGWFSTNILGNKDGLVLNEPENFKTKENSKLESLNSILEPDVYPDLYGDLYHSVKINYYPPRGDAKEGWDNIDIFGWMGYPMQIKINFLCRDSILAAPIVLDLSLLLWLAKKKKRSGVQSWLSFYFKHPQNIAKEAVVHQLHTQHENLLNQIQEWSNPQPES